MRCTWLVRAKHFLAVIFLQVTLAGMNILTKKAFNQGMSNYVLVVYRHAVATIIMAPFAAFLNKEARPKMTWLIFIKIILLGLLEPVIGQNLYFLGMKYTTATFTAAIVNILPAVTFVMAWLVRLEIIKIKTIRSQAKIVGTIATVTGAMVMTVMKGPMLHLFWIEGKTYHEQASHNGVTLHSSIKGALFLIAGSFGWGAFMILQAITLKSYPAELLLTVWICLFGTLEGSIVAMVMERGNFGIWAIKWDNKLLVAIYCGVFCSGLGYYIQGVVMNDKCLVFVTAFSPLCMVMVAIMSTIILAEPMFLGRVIGAIIIVAGLYMIVWGKSKDHKHETSNDHRITKVPMTEA